MVHIEGQIIIHRPVEDVFDFVADECNEPRYNRRMLRAEQTTPGPIGPGTRFQAETKMMGRPTPMTIEFTAYERPRRLTSSTHLASLDIQGTLSFDPVPEGTRMRWSWEMEPRGMYKLMTPLVALVGQHLEESNWAELRRYLERRETPPSSRSERAAETQA